MAKSGSQPLLAAQQPGGVETDKMVGGENTNPSGNEIWTSQQQFGDSGLHQDADQLGLDWYKWWLLCAYKTDIYFI